MSTLSDWLQHYFNFSLVCNVEVYHINPKVSQFIVRPIVLVKTISSFPTKDTSNSFHVLPQMDLRERETAAAVQDLEVRQMELEAQRRRFEQVTGTSYSTSLPPSFPFCGLY